MKKKARRRRKQERRKKVRPGREDFIITKLYLFSLFIINNHKRNKNSRWVFPSNIKNTRSPAIMARTVVAEGGGKLLSKGRVVRVLGRLHSSQQGTRRDKQSGRDLL